MPEIGTLFLKKKASTVPWGTCRRNERLRWEAHWVFQVASNFSLLCTPQLLRIACKPNSVNWGCQDLHENQYIILACRYFFTEEYTRACYLESFSFEKLNHSSTTSKVSYIHKHNIKLICVCYIAYRYPLLMSHDISI